MLAVHPDKGGDAAEFREVQTSFEVLREMVQDGSVGSFADASGRSTADAYSSSYDNHAGRPTPSWEYYSSAAAEAVPIYRTEQAKSGRSKCSQKGKKAKRCSDELIDKGAVRVGTMNMEAGAYGRWVHVQCWRVPSKVWLGLPDPAACSDKAQFEKALSSMNEVLFCGFNELPPAGRLEIVRHVMDKSNWARLVKRKGGAPAASSAPASIADTTAAAAATSEVGAPGGGHGALPPRSALAVAPQPAAGSAVAARSQAGGRFAMPVVGVNGAQANFLAGKTVVLTGVFPEVGGGAGLNLGKDKLKAMVSAFGGRVTGAISGKTNILIVGQSPGYSKVSKAKAQGGKVKLMSVRDLKAGIEGGRLENIKPAPAITSFSTGYRGNGLGPAIKMGETWTPPAQITSSAAAAAPATGTCAAVVAVKKEEKSTVPMPPGWEIITLPDGRTYYANRTTQESRWTAPDSEAPAAVPTSTAKASTAKANTAKAAKASGSGKGQTKRAAKEEPAAVEGAVAPRGQPKKRAKVSPSEMPSKAPKKASKKAPKKAPKKKAPLSLVPPTDADVEFTVRAILGERKRKGKAIEYKIAWEGYTAADNTWEPRAALSGALGKLAAYQAGKKKSKSKKPVSESGKSKAGKASRSRKPLAIQN